MTNKKPVDFFSTVLLE